MARPKHVAPRELLERVDRRLLARYLAPYTAFFAAYGIDLATLAETDQNDRVLVHRVHDLLHAATDAPPKLLRDTLAVAGVANPATCEEAIRLDEDRRLPRGRLPPEDIAFTLFLDHPELFAKLRPVAVAPAARGYSEFEPSAARAFPTSRELLDRVEDAIADDLEQRSRKRYCKIFLVEDATEVTLDVAYGRLPAARDHVVGDGDASALRLEQETRVHTESARVLVTKATGRLAIAGYPFMKEMIRRYVGELLFGDPAFYEGRALLTFEPLRKSLDATLDHEDVPGLARVALRSLTLERPGGPGPTFPAGAFGDVRRTPDSKLMREALAIEGRITKVTLAFSLTGRTRAATVHARANDAHLALDRSDAELEAIVRDYMVRRGMLDMPTRDTTRASDVG